MAKANGANHESGELGTLFRFPESAVEVESQPAEDTTVAVREVEFAVLPDGRMVDLVSRSGQFKNLEFLLWQDGRIRLTSFVEQDGERLVPPKLEPSVISALRLPATLKPCPPVNELFLQLMQQIEAYVDISEEHRFLNAAFILSSWFADRLHIVPYLSLCGAPDDGAATLLRVLHCLCRRAIHAADITSASLYHLSTQVLPTCLIEEADFGNRRLQRLLRGGNHRGSRVFSNDKAYENFGPKVVTSRFPLDSTILASSTVHIVMTPSSRDLATLDAGAEQALADTFQPMLEMFRLQHYGDVAASRYPGFRKFPSGLRECAAALGAPMLGNAELLEQLAGALETQVDGIRFERFAQPEYLVLLALFNAIHQTKRDIYVGEVTQLVNGMLRDPRDHLSEKKVGHILNKSLGFPTRRRGEGYRVETSGAIAERIHNLAKIMGLTRNDINDLTSAESGLVALPCKLCIAFGLMVDHDGRKVRTLSEIMG